MARETVAEKAARYLAEGRLVVWFADDSTIRAFCRGDGARYNQRWKRDARQPWKCDCPNTSPNCAHLIALRLVTAPAVRSQVAEP